MRKWAHEYFLWHTFVRKFDQIYSQFKICQHAYKSFDYTLFYPLSYHAYHSRCISKRFVLGKHILKNASIDCHILNCRRLEGEGCIVIRLPPSGLVKWIIWKSIFSRKKFDCGEFSLFRKSEDFLNWKKQR